jgi:hypothetical protein
MTGDRSIGMAAFADRLHRESTMMIRLRGRSGRIPEIAAGEGSRRYGPALLPGDILDGVLARDRAGRQVVGRLDAGRPSRVESG